MLINYLYLLKSIHFNILQI